MFGTIENSIYERDEIINFVDRNIISVKKKYTKEDKIEYVDISSIDKEKQVISNTTKYLVKNAPSRAQQCIKTNDILISTVRPNLKNIAIYRSEKENVVASSGFCILRANKECNHRYLFNVVNSDIFTLDMTHKTTGSNYPAIRDNDILFYKIPRPPIELQNKFAKIVELIDKQKFNYINKIKLIKEIINIFLGGKKI